MSMVYLFIRLCHLQFLSLASCNRYKSLTSLVKIIPRYFIFPAHIKGIVFWVTLSNSLLSGQTALKNTMYINHIQVQMGIDKLSSILFDVYSLRVKKGLRIRVNCFWQWVMNLDVFRGLANNIKCRSSTGMQTWDQWH